MKTALSFLFFFFLVNAGKAQVYIPGATDIAGDMTQPQSPDAKAISHATDITADSIRFKMEFFRRIDNISWNVKIGLDTNNNITDGGTWAGLNQSMKYDLLADVYNNPSFPPALGNLYDGAGTWISGNISISIPDTNIVVIGLRLSDVQQSGTGINYIAGTGLVVGIVNDDIPNANYISIPASTGIANPAVKAEIALYPNPSAGILHFSVPGISNGTQSKFQVTDKLGKIIQSGGFSSTTHSVNIESLAPGVYFLHISNGKFSSVQEFIRK